LLCSFFSFFHWKFSLSTALFSFQEWKILLQLLVPVAPQHERKNGSLNIFRKDCNRDKTVRFKYRMPKVSK
jgi:hypothetical protein